MQIGVVWPSICSNRLLLMSLTAIMDKSFGAIRCFIFRSIQFLSHILDSFEIPPPPTPPHSMLLGENEVTEQCAGLKVDQFMPKEGVGGRGEAPKVPKNVY